MIELQVQGLTNSQVQSGAYAMILVEKNGTRRIPIVIGAAEAQSIALGLEKMPTPRPLTHDLMISFAKAVNVSVKKAYIYKFDDGIFYSYIYFNNGKETFKLDSRTSDAISIALRTGVPIYTNDKVMQECGIDVDELEAAEDPADADADHTGDVFDTVDDAETADDTVPPDPKNAEESRHFDAWLSKRTEEEINQRMQEAVQEEKYELAKRFQDEMTRRKSGKRNSK